MKAVNVSELIVHILYIGKIINLSKMESDDGEFFSLQPRFFVK